MELPKSDRSGVYAIVHKESGKAYVGSTCHFRKRARAHVKALRENRHHARHLQRAWNAYGEGALEFRILAECSKEDCLAQEQAHMDRMRSHDPAFGYNASKKAGSGPGRPPGWHHSAETCAKVSANLTGRKLSAECRAKLSKIGKGRSQSAEHVAKRMASRKAKGWEISAETRARMSAAHKGYVPSPEQRAKIGAAGKGRKQSAEWVAKRMATKAITLATVGQKPRSEESRARQSAAQRGRRHSEATLAKMSRSQTGNRHATGHKQSPEHLARRVASYRAAVARRRGDDA
jgi:group I intron endonuclease